MGILVADKCSSGLSNDDDDGYIADIILCLGIINSRVHVPWGWGEISVLEILVGDSSSSSGISIDY